MRGLERDCASVPVVALESQLVTQPVLVESAASINDKVSCFLSGLAQANPAENAEGSDVLTASDLFLPHPLDAAVYTRMLAERAGTPLATLSPAALQSQLDAARADLAAKYQHARTKMRSLLKPESLEARKHDSVGTEYPTDVPTPRTAIRDQIRELQQAHTTSPPTLVQFAVHNPNAGFHVTQVILITAQHTLADLKAAIYCVADKHVAAWNDAHREPPAPKGGLFFFDRTLFTDRTPGAADYAAPVLNLLQETTEQAKRVVEQFMEQRALQYTAPTPAPEMQVKSMQATKIGSLSLEVGHPGYLYAHAGACEHMITVQDVRLAHPSDPAPHEYPCTVFRCAPRVRRCCICAKRPATSVVHDDGLAPCSPAFFCSPCYDLLHLDAAGNPLPEAGALQKLPYFHE